MWAAPLLVADEDVVDGEFAQGVVDGEDGSAGVTEDGGDALAYEGGPIGFRSRLVGGLF